MSEAPNAAAPPAPTEGAAPAVTEAEAEAEPKNAIARIVQKAAAREAAKPPEQPATTGDAPATTKTEPEGEKQPEEKGLSLKHAQLKSEHRQAVAEREKLKGELGDAKKELDGLKGKAKRNPFKLLEELTGESFKQLVERGAKGEYDERRGLSPEERAELDEIKQWRAEQKRQADEREQATQRTDDLKLCTDFLTEHADAYPVFAAGAWAADELVDRAYAALQKGEQPDLAAIAKKCEETALDSLEKWLTNDRAAAALAKRPKLVQILGKAFGPAQQPAVRPASGKSGESDGNGPRTLSHTATQESPVPPPPSEDREETPDDWLEGARARLRQAKQHGRVIG